MWPLLVQYTIGALLLVVGLAKVRQFRAFALVIRDFKLIPEAFASWVAACLVVSEIALGTSLVLGFNVTAALAASSVLFTIFGVALSAVLLRKTDVANCGCAGSWSGRVRWSSVARNLGLALVALGVVIDAPAAALSSALLLPIPKVKRRRSSSSLRPEQSQA